MAKSYKSSQATAQQQGGVGNRSHGGKMANAKQSAGKVKTTKGKC